MPGVYTLLAALMCAAYSTRCWQSVSDRIMRDSADGPAGRLPPGPCAGAERDGERTVESGAPHASEAAVACESLPPVQPRGPDPTAQGGFRTRGCQWAWGLGHADEAPASAYATFDSDDEVIYGASTG
jgi:hypothetical protein